MYFSIGKINNVTIKNSSFYSLQYALTHLNIYESYIAGINTKEIIKSIIKLLKKVKMKLFFKRVYVILIQHINLHIIKRKIGLGIG